jgi:hypothetical protein
VEGGEGRGKSHGPSQDVNGADGHPWGVLTTGVRRTTTHTRTTNRPRQAQAVPAATDLVKFALHAWWVWACLCWVLGSIVLFLL